MSFIVAGWPALVTTVLSLIFNERDFSLPAMVNVFVFSSADTIMPWKVIGCSFAAEPAGDALGLAFVAVIGRGDTLGEGDAFIGAARVLKGSPMLSVVR